MSSEKPNPFKGYNSPENMKKSGFRNAPNRFWKFAFSREAFKFILYVTLPVFAGVIYANPDAMKKLILHFRFIEYPASDSGPEIEAFKRSLEDKRLQREIEKATKKEP
eukprot:gene13264-14570_t